MSGEERLLEAVGEEVCEEYGIPLTISQLRSMANTLSGDSAEASPGKGNGAQAAVLPREAEQPIEKQGTNHREKCCRCAYYKDGMCRLYSVTCVNSPSKTCFSQKSPGSAINARGDKFIFQCREEENGASRGTDLGSHY